MPAEPEIEMFNLTGNEQRYDKRRLLIARASVVGEWVQFFLGEGNAVAQSLELATSCQQVRGSIPALAASPPPGWVDISVL